MDSISDARAALIFNDVLRWQSKRQHVKQNMKIRARLTHRTFPNEEGQLLQRHAWGHMIPV